VGRKTLPTKVKPSADEMAVMSEHTAEEKKKKEKGKSDRRTTSTSGIWGNDAFDAIIS